MKSLLITGYIPLQARLSELVHIAMSQLSQRFYKPSTRGCFLRNFINLLRQLRQAEKTLYLNT